jgi:hypothetical protein
MVLVPGDKVRLRRPGAGIAAYVSRLRKPHHTCRVRTAGQQTSQQRMTSEVRMATMTHYVALAFMRSEDCGIVACDPKKARNSDQAMRMAGLLAVMEGYCGAIAFSRTGDPALGDFGDAVILRTFGEVDSGLL